MKLNLTRVGAAVVTAGLAASLGAVAPVPALADETPASSAAVETTAAGETAESKTVATIGDATYASLDEALAAANSGDTIELQQDGVIATTNTISKAVTIKGNGKYSVEVKSQSGTDDGRLNISGAGSLTFDNAKVSFGNPSNWSVYMSDSGKLSFVNGSAATFTQHGIYTKGSGVEINVDKSSLTFSGTSYTSLMNEFEYKNKEKMNTISMVTQRLT